ncbi:unnamed protein product [Protopolystoma xenopodis]|uniref:Uncharacterized protein n=1 Tax=Protopolystoma xenopodis TaxID=117903 RepID=A0A448XJD1_9PLAT|nr:unnamed protein product [Protopolystoma xenopodis]
MCTLLHMVGNSSAHPGGPVGIPGSTRLSAISTHPARTANWPYRPDRPYPSRRHIIILCPTSIQTPWTSRLWGTPVISTNQLRTTHLAKALMQHLEWRHVFERFCFLPH